MSDADDLAELRPPKPKRERKVKRIELAEPMLPAASAPGMRLDVEITPQIAFAEWLAIPGGERTVVELMTRLKAKYVRLPAVSLVAQWRTKDKWHDRAKDYEGRVATEVIRRLEDGHVEVLVPVVEQIVRFETDGWEKALRAIKVLEPESITELKALTDALVAVGKWREVLTGGVSDRTEVAHLRGLTEEQLVNGIRESMERIGVTPEELMGAEPEDGEAVH